MIGNITRDKHRDVALHTGPCSVLREGLLLPSSDGQSWMLACSSREYFLNGTLKDPVEGSISMTFAIQHEGLSDIPFFNGKKKGACASLSSQPLGDRDRQILEV